MSGMVTYKIFDSQEIAAGGAYTTPALDIASANALALHLQSITGTSPDVTFTYSLGTDKSGTFVTPASPATIGANIGAVDVLDFAPEACRYLKITATNNNGSNAVSLTGVLAVQTN